MPATQQRRLVVASGAGGKHIRLKANLAQQLSRTLYQSMEYHQVPWSYYFFLARCSFARLLVLLVPFSLLYFS
jgi:hypothetical protein